MTRTRTAVLALLASFGAAAATTAHADDQIFVGSPTGSVYVGSSTTGEFTYFACFCIGPIVSIQPFGSDMLVADSFGGIWKLDGLTGEFLTGAWTGRSVLDMVVDGDTALLVLDDGSVAATPVDAGFPIDTIDAPAGATSILLFDGDTYVGTADGTIHRQAEGEASWAAMASLPQGVATLAARPDALVAADDEGNAIQIDWTTGDIEGYYVAPDVVDSGFTGGFTLFTQSPGSVSVFDADTGTQTATWTVPVTASAIYVRPGTVCKADTNRNGILEAGDFNAWITAYNLGDFVADQNNDLAITPADFNAWIQAYNAGCN